MSQDSKPPSLWQRLVRLVQGEPPAADKAPSTPPSAPEPPPAVEPPTLPRNEALEAAISAAPESLEAWRAYGDWLVEGGHPHGAVVLAAIEQDGVADVSGHEAELCGEVATRLEPYVDVAWHMGFWQTLAFSCDYETAESIPEGFDGSGGVAAYTLGHPSARFVEGVTFGLVDGVMDGQADWQSSLDALAKTGPHRMLRDVFVGDFEQEETEISWTCIGDFDAVWAALPALQHLKIHGCSIGLGPMVAPKLQSLRIQSGGLSGTVLESIAAASLPALTVLQVWMGAEDYGGDCTLEQVTAMLANPSLEALTWLGLMNCEFSDELPAAVLASGRLPQLTALDLSMGVLSDAGGQVILDHAEAFAHLETLNLGDSYLSSEMVAKLQAALPQVDAPDQDVGDVDGDEVWRYVSVAE